MSERSPGDAAPRPVLPSLLTKPLGAFLAVVLALAVVVVANTAYLVAHRMAEPAGWRFFSPDPVAVPAFLQAMILTHTAVGTLVVVLGLAFFLLHLRHVWSRRHTASILSGVAVVTGAVLLLVTGLFILTEAASRQNRWAWWLHVGAALLAPAGYAVHRMTSYARPTRRRRSRYAAAVVAATLALFVGHALSIPPAARTGPSGATVEEGSAGAADRRVTEYVAGPFVPPGTVPEESPFFPSPVTTTSGRTTSLALLVPEARHPGGREAASVPESPGDRNEDLVGAASCARCHADVTAQWAASAHRFASFNNPFYAASVELLRRRPGGPGGVGHVLPGRVKSRWCAGCHDPALLFTGRMLGEIDPAETAARAGLTCLACHTIDRIHDRTGNGNYNLDDGSRDPYLFADADPGSVGELLHDAALKARPEAHRRRLLEPSFSTSEYCATCHKVSLREPVNDYRWVRGQNEYDAWHDSGISLNAARTFYLPSGARTCQDCHMPPEPAVLGDLAADGGTVRSHRFLGANTALPFVRGDDETVARTEAFLRSDRLVVDIFQLRPEGADSAWVELGEEVGSVRPGEEIRFDVVVRNLGVGHTFPGGTNDSNEGWLEVTLLDSAGRILVESGRIGADGHLDPFAHVYEAVLLDGEGRPIERRNAQDIHVTAAANVIGPGTADVAHYALRIPETVAGDALTLRARLLWRKFDRPFTEFSWLENRGGFPGFDGVPDLPVTEIAADELRVHLGRAGGGPAGAGPSGAGTERDSGEASTHPSPAEEASTRPRWMRHNDHGIALLLEGSTRDAADAFARVEAIAPERIDGPLNLARTALAEGNLERAYGHLERAEGLAPGDARGAWVWARVLQEDGRYEDAALAYRRVLRDFPDDRGAWLGLGRTLYLDRRYEEALEALGRVLGIDPEERVAHYHRMLALRALGREVEAAAAEAAWAYYSVDEAAVALTRAYLDESPGVNLMAQPIHTHRLEPVSLHGGEVGGG